MYLGQMTCNIIIANTYRLRGLNEVEIKKSVHQIVQTAKLTLPLSVVIKNSEIEQLQRIQIIDRIKEGDRITIAFGYDNVHNLEFSGFIKRINPKQPLELELEDEMYLLRKLRLTKTFMRNDIRDVLTWMMDELYAAYKTRFQIYDKLPQVTVYNLRINGANGIQVLQDLADKYLLSSYLFWNNCVQTLYCGLPYGRKGNNIKYVLNKNTININDLKYQIRGITTYKVEMQNIQPSGQVKKYVFGDPKGEEIKLSYPGNRTEAELKHFADSVITTYGATGYRGKFEALMFPNPEPGDLCNLSDNQFKDRKGNYYIGSVTTKFGVNGGKRIPEIDIVL